MSAPQESRTVVVATRVTPTEKRQMDLAAARHGRSLSDLLFDRTEDLRELGSQLAEAMKAIPLPAEFQEPEAAEVAA